MSEKEEILELHKMEEDEIPDSQGEETQQQSSCETLLSQQSINADLSEKPDDKVYKVAGVTSAETSALNSSLEANTSGENVESSYSEKPSCADILENVSQEVNPSPLKEGLTDENEGEITEGRGSLSEEKEKSHHNSSTIQETKKRKQRSDDSTPSPKRLRKIIEEKNDTTQDRTESISEDHFKTHDISVMEISSTPEKTIVIDDSQEFSLRIEETSPPTSQLSREKLEKDQATPKKSEPDEVVTVDTAMPESVPALSNATANLSDKSVVSWTSHTNYQNLSWGSPKNNGDENMLKGEISEHANNQAGDSQKTSSPDSQAENVSVREVTETRTCYAVITWFIDGNNKVVSAKLKQISLLEEHPIEKPGRMSTVSTTSAKSSSSTGSVGLPGPFPLPGNTMKSRMSTLSTASSATSSSSASNQAWDGPFLKPPVPGSKSNVTFSCDKCGHYFPLVDRHVTTSPIVNGSSPIIVEESDVKCQAPKRGRKPQASNSSSATSSELLEDEISSSGSQPPQATSTPTKSTRGRKGPKKQNEPAPRSVRTPRSVGRPSRNGTAHSATPASKILTGLGEAVLARWGGDGHYYPGWVSDPLTASQVLVRFCDGQSKPTAVSKVVKAEVIMPGTLVLAATRSGEYEEALVVEVNTSGPEPVFMVERDKSQREVKFASIALQQSTVTELTGNEAQKMAASSNFNNLSLENIIAHPRKRSVRTPVGSGSGRKKKRQTTPQPCTSHGQTYNGPDDTCGDTDSSTQSTCSLDLRGKEMRPLDVECFPPESLDTKLVYKRGNMTFKKKEGHVDRLVELLGPIPEPGTQLFTDCVFLITYTDNVKLKGRDLEYSSVEEASGCGTILYLWKDRLRMQIRNGGGKVYNSFSEVTKEELPNTYLITDKQSSTPLYLQCLVNGVPIYSHSVVIQCCTQNRPWKEMISSRGVKQMIAGYSLSRRCLVNPRSSTPLRGRNLLLALSGDPSLSAFWQSLITEMGGSVDLYPHGSLDGTKYDVVVTDCECDRDLVGDACEQRVALVSTTWLQQVVITGEWRPPTEHPLYKYNTSGDGEGESPEY